ncbi:hypothetical protein ACS6Z9_04515, partial [Streptococcus suis]
NAGRRFSLYQGPGDLFRLEIGKPAMYVAGLSPTLTGCFRSEIGTVGRRSFFMLKIKNSQKRRNINVSKSLMTCYLSQTSSIFYIFRGLSTFRTAGNRFSSSRVGCLKLEMGILIKHSPSLLLSMQ